jgi:thioester reductase-like protein
MSTELRLVTLCITKRKSLSTGRGRTTLEERWNWRTKGTGMARKGYDEVVLLTGFPSFGARKMCEELVSGGERVLVHAVVRRSFLAEARGALDELPLEARGRVNLIEGDAASMDLGLSGPEWKELAREVDRIHHCAQVSYLGVDEKTAMQVNVGGAREVLELATACESLKCLVIHSTAQVAGDRTGLVREDELECGQAFRNAVEESRARAEKLVRRHMARVPVCVLRPTMIVGDSRSGEVDRFDGPYLLILLIVTSPPDFALPFPGRGDALLHVVPIDFVVRAAKAIGRDPRAPGKTFHLADPAPLSARRAFELVAQAGGRKLPRGFIPANLTKALLRTPGLERFAKSPRALLDALATPVQYTRTNADAILGEANIRCPPFESYVDRLVEYVQFRLREKRARRDAEVADPLG